MILETYELDWKLNLDIGNINFVWKHADIGNIILNAYYGAAKIFRKFDLLTFSVGDFVIGLPTLYSEAEICNT